MVKSNGEEISFFDQQLFLFVFVVGLNYKHFLGFSLVKRRTELKSPARVIICLFVLTRNYGFEIDRHNIWIASLSYLGTSMTQQEDNWCGVFESTSNIWADKIWFMKLGHDYFGVSPMKYSLFWGVSQWPPLTILWIPWICPLLTCWWPKVVRTSQTEVQKS